MGSAMSNPKPLDFPYTDVIVAPVIEARRVRVADVDGEEFEKAPGGPFPCSGDESRKHRPAVFLVTARSDLGGAYQVS